MTRAPPTPTSGFVLRSPALQRVLQRSAPLHRGIHTEQRHMARTLHGGETQRRQQNNRLRPERCFGARTRRRPTHASRTHGAPRGRAPTQLCPEMGSPVTLPHRAVTRALSSRALHTTHKLIQGSAYLVPLLRSRMSTQRDLERVLLSDQHLNRRARVLLIKSKYFIVRRWDILILSVHRR